MFAFCSLSAHFAKRRNNLLIFHCGKRTCLLSVHFLLTLQREEINLLTLHCRKRMSSPSAVKKPISSLSAAKNNLLNWHCRKRTSYSLSVVKKQSVHFLQ